MSGNRRVHRIRGVRHPHSSLTVLIEIVSLLVMGAVVGFGACITLIRSDFDFTTDRASGFGSDNALTWRSSG